MIRIRFIEPTTDDWKAWRADCVTATNALVAAAAVGANLEITDLYKDGRMKHVYVSTSAPFFGKCVYCESRISNNQPGDVEHYRPAGRVTELDSNVVMVIRADGISEPHPGYYWLAYDWQNLLIACADCNRPHRFKTGNLVGKWDKFPIAGARASSPGTEGGESPLLLNPVLDDPADHLQIDEIGILHDRSSIRGKTTIDVLGLNQREALVQERKQAFHDARNTFRVWMIAIAMTDFAEAQNQLARLEAIENGSASFAMAARFAIDQLTPRARSELTQFLN